MTLHTKCRWINPKSKEICTPNRKKYVPKQIYFLKEGACMRWGKKHLILLFQYTRGDKGRSNERKENYFGKPYTQGRVCKNLKKSETRPDPNFRVSLMHGTRNLKFHQVKPDPTRTRKFGFGVFLGFLGFLEHSYVLQ